jgi:hypothetical protein
MKNNQLLPYLEAIETIKDLKLGGKISLAIIKNKKKLIAAHDDIEALRVQLCEQYADKDEEGKAKKDDKGYVISTDNVIIVNKEYIYILNDDCKVELEKINPAVLEQFSDITVNQIEALMLFTE